MDTTTTRRTSAATTNTMAAFRRALALRPDLAEAWLGQGNAFFLLKRYQDAASSYGRALAIRPNLVEAQIGRGNVFSVLKQHRDAANAYAAVLRFAPEHPFTKGLLLYQKLLGCDWSGIDRQTVSEQARKNALRLFTIAQKLGTEEGIRPGAQQIVATRDFRQAYVSSR